METKIRAHIDELFEGVTPSRKAVELKEEMIQNLCDKYSDLIREGKSEEAAYNIAVAGIGDISSLLSELEKDSSKSNFAVSEEDDKQQRKSAILTAVAVMLFIVSILPLVILEGFGQHSAAQAVGVPLMIAIVAVGVGLLIYNNMTKKKSKSSSDTIVDDFREWQSDEKERKQMRKAISSALWSLVLLAYFVVSFTTGAWFITWVIFIAGAALESIINIFFSTKKKTK